MTGSFPHNPFAEHFDAAGVTIKIDGVPVGAVECLTGEFIIKPLPRIQLDSLVTNQHGETLTIQRIEICEWFLRISTKWIKGP